MVFVVAAVDSVVVVMVGIIKVVECNGVVLTYKSVVVPGSGCVGVSSSGVMYVEEVL